MTTIDTRPVWATRHEGTEDGEPGWFARDLTTATVLGACDFGDFPADSASEVAFEITQHPGEDAPTIQLHGTPSTGMSFIDAAALREFARALDAAADEFERIQNA